MAHPEGVNILSGGRAKGKRLPYPSPRPSLPTPRYLEHRHLACGAQAGSLCSRVKGLGGVWVRRQGPAGPGVTGCQPMGTPLPQRNFSGQFLMVQRPTRKT